MFYIYSARDFSIIYNRSIEKLNQKTPTKPPTKPQNKYCTVQKFHKRDKETSQKYSEDFKTYK